MKRFTCIRCAGAAERDGRATSLMCIPCKGAHYKEGKAATSEVHKAIRRGDLSPATALQCADCAGQARDWDHRDYLAPLSVTAVCKACNLKRGPAFDSVRRPDGETERPVYIKTDARTTRYQPAQA